MWLTNSYVCDFNIFHVYGQALSSKVWANVCVIYILKLVFCRENDTALWGILAIYRVIFGYYNVVGGCGEHLVGRDPWYSDSLWNKKKCSDSRKYSHVLMPTPTAGNVWLPEARF